MTDIRIQARTRTLPSNAEGTWIDQRGTKDGARFTVDTKQHAIMQGRGHHVTIGALTTPIRGGGAAEDPDLDQPEGIISVPSGTAIMPIRVSVQVETPLIVTDADVAEILVAVDTEKAYDGSGTKATEVVFNMKTDEADDGAACSAFSAFTADATAPVLAYELMRAQTKADVQGTAANALWGDLALLYEPDTPTIIVGPAMLLLYWGGTVATSAFAQVQWIEYPTSMFSA